MYRRMVWALALGLVFSAAAAGQVPNKDAIHGLMFSDGVIGQKAPQHGWLHESIWAIPVEKGAGTGADTDDNPQGRYRMPGDNKEFPGFTPGRHMLFSLGFDSVSAFGIRSDLTIADNGAASGNADLASPAHYSVMYHRQPVEWGRSPYLEGTDFYQTFVATSNHVTRVAVKLGGKSGDHQALVLNHAIYETNDGPPSTWKQISPVRSRLYANRMDPIIVIFPVYYRSSEVTLTPGKTYAVRFSRDAKSTSETFTIVARTKNGDGYRDGCLYKGDEKKPNLDAFAYVSGGTPGTIVNDPPIEDLELKSFAGAGTRFGQTFKASGTSLAAVDTLYTTGQIHPPSLPLTFRVYDQPGDKQIGPERVCFGSPRPFQARAAAAWLPGEVPLVPGRMYFIEWTFPVATNTWVLNEDLPGEAYIDGKAHPKADLAMSIVEYEGAEVSK